MPPRQARSGRRGRPPFDLGRGSGKKGSIKLHKPSGTNAAAITVHLHTGHCIPSETVARRIAGSNAGAAQLGLESLRTRKAKELSAAAQNELVRLSGADAY